MGDIETLGIVIGSVISLLGSIVGLYYKIGKLEMKQLEINHAYHRIEKKVDRILKKIGLANGK